MGPLHIQDTSLLGAEEIAALLGLSVKAVYQLRHRGTLPPAVKWGNTIRWTRSDIEEWIEAQHEGVKK